MYDVDGRTRCYVVLKDVQSVGAQVVQWRVRLPMAEKRRVETKQANPKP